MYDRSGKAIRVIGTMKDITMHKQTEEAVLSIAKGVLDVTGHVFFRSLMEHLAKSLGADYAFVGELMKERPGRVRTVVVWGHGCLVDNFEYDLAGTPCANVVRQRLCGYGSGIQQLFPLDHLLADMGIEGYVGAPLNDAHRKTLGLLVVMFQKPVDNLALAESILNIFGVRTASELEREQKEEALRESEQLFHTLARVSPVGIFRTDVTGECLYVNERWCDIAGISHETAAGHGWTAALHPDDRERVGEEWTQAARSCQPFTSEYRYQTAAQKITWVVGQAQAELDQDGNVLGFVGTITDITERKANEQLLVAERRILEMIATAAPLQEVLAQMCRVIEDLSAGARCSILLLDRDGRHLRHGAAPSLPEAYVQAIDGVAIGPTVGSCGTAAFLRRQVIVSDIARDPLWADYRDLALCHGLRACWSTPVSASDGTVLGTFAVYYHAPRQPTPAELQLIDRAMHLACIAIERKQAEAALREHHVLLSAIMDTATDFIYVKDLAGCYLLANPALARFMGKSVEQVLGQDGHALLPPDLAASCMTADQQVITTGATVTQEEYGLVGGKTKAYLTTKAPYRDYEGRIIGVIGVSRDISERKRTEEEIRKSHAFIRQIIDVVPNFIFVKDRAGQYTLVNKALADAYGTTVEFLLGKTDANFNANQEEVEFFRQKDLEVMDTLQERFIPEEVITDSTGKRRWLQTVKRPIFDEQGQAVMVLGASTDITERKRAEGQIQQSLVQLRELTQQLEMVQESERKRLARELHDEFGQIITALKLDLTWLSRQPSQAGDGGQAESITYRVQAMKKLVDALAQSTRRIASSLRPSVLDDLGVIPALRWLARDFQERTGIECEVQISADVAEQEFDGTTATALFRIAQELLTNIIRHANAQRVQISLAADDGVLAMIVRDNGKGITKHDLARPTSFGLRGIRERAMLIGGTFTIDGAPHQGTTVTLRVPLTRQG